MVQNLYKTDSRFQNYIPSPKTLFTDLSNITFNWLVAWKMTWRIWQIFTRALRNLKIGILMESFNPKLKEYELKIHRGGICHDNEEWRKIWRGIDVSFQSSHEVFDEFYPSTRKSQKFSFQCAPFEKGIYCLS